MILSLIVMVAGGGTVMAEQLMILWSLNSALVMVGGMGEIMVQ
jgi:hypothetical protein